MAERYKQVVWSIQVTAENPRRRRPKTAAKTWSRGKGFKRSTR